MTIKIFGLEIERKTEFVALAAFFLASASVIYQLVGFFRGPDIKIFSPEQVLIIAEDYPSSGLYARFATRLAYVNNARLGYNDVIRGESMVFSLGGRDYEQSWQTFESFSLKKSKLQRHYVSDAHPFPVKAGSAVSHETYFAPRSVRCPSGDQKCDKWKNYLKWDDFVKELTKVKKLKFVLKSETYSGSKLKAECIIDVDEDLIKRLKETKWAAPSCWGKME